MRYLSSRGEALPVGAAQAILSGAPADGGLYVPETLPGLDADALAPVPSLPEWAARLLAPFFADSPLGEGLAGLCADVYDFPCPLTRPYGPGEPVYALELFHGPTGAFKDFGARFLMAALDRLAGSRGFGRPVTVLAATSGDTGGAVGHAAEGRAHLRALILYPKGRVSPFQEHQLCCWGAPVASLEVAGDFDACQSLVKAAFAQEDLTRAHGLTSANSINIARLMPQTVYWAQAALQLYHGAGTAPGLIVPTGNLGNAVAALYARAMGLPIGPVVLATNANATLSDWQASGRFEPRPSIATLANAMDVGAPSNFERLRAMAGGDGAVTVHRVEDGRIAARIRADYEAHGVIWCPHSATAAAAYAALAEADRQARPWILAATAHPFKFRELVQPLIGTAIEPTPALAAVMDRPVSATAISASLEDLATALERV